LKIELRCQLAWFEQALPTIIHIATWMPHIPLHSSISPVKEKKKERQTSVRHDCNSWSLFVTWRSKCADFYLNSTSDKGTLSVTLYLFLPAEPFDEACCSLGGDGGRRAKSTG
jgi:hypothetical protein